MTALSRAVLANEGIEDAAADLGGERAARGVGLVEALDDLAVLFRLTGNHEPPFGATRVFASAWVEVATSALLDRATVDPVTGLQTRDYLLPRVRELYAEAAVRGIHVGDERCLLVVDEPQGAPHGWQRVIRAGMVGRVLSSVLDRGQTNAVLPSGRCVSIVYRDDALEENVVRVRRALSANAPQDAPLHTVSIESLPTSVHDAESLLLGL